MLPDPERQLVRGGVEQVVHLLVVNLHVANLHFKTQLGALALGDALEKGVAESGDDSRVVLAAHHRVRLARACVPHNKGISKIRHGGDVPKWRLALMQ